MVNGYSPKSQQNQASRNRPRAPPYPAREFHVFHPTDDDSPMDSPVEKNQMGHLKNWYDRCAKDITDGQHIKDMWAKFNKADHG